MISPHLKETNKLPNVMQGIMLERIFFFIFEREWFESYNDTTHFHREHGNFIALLCIGFRVCIERPINCLPASPRLW